MKFYKKGFTIIELLIVIAIIGILVGVAVPYYNDYIYDSRVSVLKQNLQTMRKVINNFRGDRGRGPFRVQVNNAGSPVHYAFSSDPTNGSELVAGAFFPDSTTRQTNINYLKSLPNFVDPTDGSNMISTISPTTDYTACFVDDNGDGIFQIDNESAFIDEDRNLQYDDGEPVIYEGGPIVDGDAGTKLDYIEFEVTGADGTKY